VNDFPEIDEQKKVKPQLYARGVEPTPFVPGEPEYEIVRDEIGVTDEDLERSRIARQAQAATLQKFQRTKFQQRRDRVDIARLYLMGFTYVDIADWLEQHRPYTMGWGTVRDDVYKIIAAWQERWLSDMDVAKAEELAKIAKLEGAYWEAWERSLKPKDSIHKETLSQMWEGARKKAGLDDENPDGGKRVFAHEKVITKRVERDGNATFLNGIQWCIDTRVKILGLAAPQTVNINWKKVAEQEGIDPDKLFNDLQDKFLEAALKDEVNSVNDDDDTDE